MSEEDANLSTVNIIDNNVDNVEIIDDSENDSEDLDIDEINIEEVNLVNANNKVASQVSKPQKTLVEILQNPQGSDDIIIGFSNLNVKGDMKLDLNTIVNSTIKQKALQKNLDPELVAKANNIVIYLINNQVQGKVLFQPKHNKVSKKKELFGNTKEKKTSNIILKIILIALLFFILYKLVKTKLPIGVEVVKLDSDIVV